MLFQKIQRHRLFLKYIFQDQARFIKSNFKYLRQGNKQNRFSLLSKMPFFILRYYYQEVLEVSLHQLKTFQIYIKSRHKAILTIVSNSKSKLRKIDKNMFQNIQNMEMNMSLTVHMFSYLIVQMCQQYFYNFWFHFI